MADRHLVLKWHECLFKGLSEARIGISENAIIVLTRRGSILYQFVLFPTKSKK